MKIVVCVKQVAIVAARDAVDPAGGGLDAERVVYAVNPYDETAVEEGLRIRDRNGGGEVVVLTLGPPRAESALRWCVAMGADRAVRIDDDDRFGPDPWFVSAALAQVLKSLRYDLVLFGKMAIDDEMGAVGTFVAEMLDLPVVTGVARIALDPAGRRARLERSLERGRRQAVECALPAVLTVDRCLNRPRYPTLAGRRRAEATAIESRPRPKNLPEGEAAPPRLEIVKVAPPKIRPRKILAPDDGASAAGRLQWVLSGGMKRKGGGPLAGDPARLADGVIAFLKERKFLE